MLADALSFKTLSVYEELCKIYLLTNIVVWMDVVYCWIKNKNKQHKTFVQNKLLEIRNTKPKFNNIQTKLISSKDNPADIASRGMNPIDLKNKNLWFLGPSVCLCMCPNG